MAEAPIWSYTDVVDVMTELFQQATDLRLRGRRPQCAEGLLRAIRSFDDALFPDRADLPLMRAIYEACDLVYFDFYGLTYGPLPTERIWGSREMMSALRRVTEAAIEHYAIDTHVSHHAAQTVALAAGGLADKFVNGEEVYDRLGQHCARVMRETFSRIGVEPPGDGFGMIGS